MSCTMSVTSQVLAIFHFLSTRCEESKRRFVYLELSWGGGHCDDGKWEVRKGREEGKEAGRQVTRYACRLSVSRIRRMEGWELSWEWRRREVKRCHWVACCLDSDLDLRGRWVGFFSCIVYHKGIEILCVVRQRAMPGNILRWAREEVLRTVRLVAVCILRRQHIGLE